MKNTARTKTLLRIFSVTNSIIPKLKEAVIITDKCIGSDGPVETVCLFSDVPLEEIEEVLLDYQSRTSVQLVQVLANRHWSVSPKWVNGSKDFVDRIGGKTAGVVIGDRAFALRDTYEHVFDLSAEWKALTGLPFVFACWVSNKKLPDEFLSEFSGALALGLEERDQAIEQMTKRNIPEMKQYVTDIISYELDDKKKEAMKLFLKWSSTD